MIGLANLKEGDILGVSRNVHWYNPATWLAARIQATTGSSWSHVGLLSWSLADGRWHVIEALWGGGVVRRDLIGAYGAFDGDLAVARLARPVDGRTRRTVTTWARMQVGRPYNRRKILQIRVLQIVLGARAVGSIMAPDLNPRQEYICSGLVEAAYRQAEFPLSGVGDFAGPAAVMRSPSLRVWRCRLSPPGPGNASGRK